MCSNKRAGSKNKKTLGPIKTTPGHKKSKQQTTKQQTSNTICSNVRNYLSESEQEMEREMEGRLERSGGWRSSRSRSTQSKLGQLLGLHLRTSLREEIYALWQDPFVGAAAAVTVAVADSVAIE